MKTIELSERANIGTCQLSENQHVLRVIGEPIPVPVWSYEDRMTGAVNPSSIEFEECDWDVVVTREFYLWLTEYSGSVICNGVEDTIYEYELDSQCDIFESSTGFIAYPPVHTVKMAHKPEQVIDIDESIDYLPF